MIEIGDARVIIDYVHIVSKLVVTPTSDVTLISSRVCYDYNAAAPDYHQLDSIECTDVRRLYFEDTALGKDGYYLCNSN